MRIDRYIPQKPSRVQNVLYFPLLCMLRMVAAMPMWMARPLSSALALIARDVVRYRRGIVHRNLEIAFPKLSNEKRAAIEKEFYNHLADYFFQTVRFRWMKLKRMKKHIHFTGYEVLEQLFKQGKDVVLYTSHFGNWEYITPLSEWMPEYKESVIFAHVNRPLKNLWFNKFYWEMRSRFNVSVPMKQVLRAMLGWRKERQRYVIGFLSDQKPGIRTLKYNVPFMGVDTPFIGGTEELARKLGLAAVYCDMSMPQRDVYNVDIKLLTDDASGLQEGELTAMYASALTETIRRQPALYLWSHNRWRVKL